MPWAALVAYLTRAMQTRRIGTLEGPGRQPRLQQLRMAHDAAQKRLRLAAPFEPHHVSSLMIVDLPTAERPTVASTNITIRSLS